MKEGMSETHLVLVPDGGKTKKYIIWPTQEGNCQSISDYYQCFKEFWNSCEPYNFSFHPLSFLPVTSLSAWPLCSPSPFLDPLQTLFLSLVWTPKTLPSLDSAATPNCLVRPCRKGRESVQMLLIDSLTTNKHLDAKTRSEEALHPSCGVMVGHMLLNSDSAGPHA